MADERLRDLERKAAGGDAAAKAAYLRALVRTGDERVVEVRELEESLRSLLERTRSHVNEEIERDHGHDDGAVGRCPELKLKHLQATARMAVGGRHGAAFGYGYKVLAKVWPRPRREGLEQEDWDPTSQAHPYTVMAFAAHDGPWRVSIDVATSWSRKPTPGTTWPALQPWRTDVRAELMERKVRSWAKGIQLQASPATVRLWLDLAALEESSHPSAEPRIVDLDRPSEKQLNYIEALVRQKQLAEGEVTDLLRVHTGAKRIVHLHRREASAVIEALLEVPTRAPCAQEEGRQGGGPDGSSGSSPGSSCRACSTSANTATRATSSS